VRVLLGTPARAIPVLSIGSVTTSELIHRLLMEVSVLAESRLSLELGEGEFSLVFKPSRLSSIGESRVRLGLWGDITGACSGSKVVLWMV